MISKNFVSLETPSRSIQKFYLKLDTIWYLRLLTYFFLPHGRVAELVVHTQYVLHHELSSFAETYQRFIYFKPPKSVTFWYVLVSEKFIEHYHLKLNSRSEKKVYQNQSHSKSYLHVRTHSFLRSLQIASFLASCRRELEQELHKT